MFLFQLVCFGILLLLLDLEKLGKLKLVQLKLSLETRLKYFLKHICLLLMNTICL
jgi:hypothetical protein